ncbi:hypothetical protein IWW57_000287 [Coemansia sp. S610]|nr:hypothetical protein IWW57_000287 [Coemansia sp. S610]
MSSPQYAEKALASSSSSITQPHRSTEEAVTLNVDPNTLTVADLYDKEKFDLETMDNKLVFQLLQCGPEGLTQAEAEARILKAFLVDSLVFGRLLPSFSNDGDTSAVFVLAQATVF